MKETSLEYEGNDLVKVLDRVFICLRSFSQDYLDEYQGTKLLKEMSGIIQSKSPDKPIPSIHNYMGKDKHELYMDFNEKLIEDRMFQYMKTMTGSEVKWGFVKNVMDIRFTRNIKEYVSDVVIREW